MKLPQNVLYLACTAGLAFLCSCATQEVQTAELVDPQVSKVEEDGYHVWVNIGLLDGLHPGQRLWVVQDTKIKSLVSVQELHDYSSRCLIVGAESLGNMDATRGVEPGDPAVGDRIARKFQDIWRTGDIRDRVPRFVTVQADASEVASGVEADVDPLLTPQERAKKERLKRIPREEYEEWKKTHLPQPDANGAGQ